MNLIKHIAFILDGNGRWAEKQGKTRTQGHYAGVQKVRDIAIACNARSIEVMTVYAFSTENWKRPEEEVSYLMGLPKVFFGSFMKELMEQNIRVAMIGEMEGIPKSTAKYFQKAIEDTKNNTGMTLCFAMNYGSQREITLAALAMAQAYKANQLTDQDFTPETLNQYLFTKDFPPVDLMIRTSGECRLSNFLLYQLAYSELMFVEEPWPDFSEELLDQCLAAYGKRDRRFGGLKP